MATTPAGATRNILALGAVALVALGALGACHRADAPPPRFELPPSGPRPDVRPPRVERILFLGNSYTYVNDLPAVLTRLAASPRSPVRFETGMLAPPGQTWEGHDADPQAATLIAQGWDDVVLQDQSEQAWSVDGIKPALVHLAEAITASGARPVLYMTWARAPRRGAEARELAQMMALARYYERHGEVTGAVVAPVGRAWERALRDPAMTLHDPDGSHPSPVGTYLAACVLYATLTGESPVGLDDGGLGLAPASIARLQQVAWDTHAARIRPAPPLVGSWPLADATSGNDLAVGRDVVLGGVRGPDGAPATRLSYGQYAAVPYLRGTNPARITVRLDAALDDWSVTEDPPERWLVARHDAFAIYRRRTDLVADIVTGDDRGGTTTTVTYAAAGLASGWHRLALTYDGQAARLWLDGAEVAAAPAQGPLRYSASQARATGVAVGGRASEHPESVVFGRYTFTGALANLAIFDRALTAAELRPTASTAP